MRAASEKPFSMSRATVKLTSLQEASAYGRFTTFAKVSPGIVRLLKSMHVFFTKTTTVAKIDIININVMRTLVAPPLGPLI